MKEKKDLFTSLIDICNQRDSVKNNSIHNQKKKIEELQEYIKKLEERICGLENLVLKT